MKVFEIFDGEDFLWVRTSSEILVEDEDMVRDTLKLKNKFLAQKEKFVNKKDVQGILVTKHLTLTFFKDGSFLGRIWAAKQTISGKYGLL